MRILVTGGAGFVGSHLIDYLIEKGHDVVCVDSFFSGKKENIAHHLSNPRFHLIAHDIRRPLKYPYKTLDRIYHLACPASPMQYQFDPVLTFETSIHGTQHMLNLARKTGARLLFTSTSEVYGDPLEHPQKESYFGNVDPLGKRACYDEGKRAAEALCKDYHEQYGVDARIVRLFNVYGPRMMFNDGRVLSNFILQALLNEDITVFRNGEQTRSFLYIDDLGPALAKRMEIESDDWRPVNLGNPD
ncbi:MAG: NAD-dependent epimerase/dehydratase family protein [Patescibacteria group bacterium]